MAFFIGTNQYFIHDFEQTLSKCSKCSENGLFIKTGVAYFQVNGLSLFPRYKNAEAQCRSCGEMTKIGEDPNTDHEMNAAMERLVIPKKFYLGAILYPLAIIAVIIFVNYT